MLKAFLKINNAVDTATKYAVTSTAFIWWAKRLPSSAENSTIIDMAKRHKFFHIEDVTELDRDTFCFVQHQEHFGYIDGKYLVPIAKKSFVTKRATRVSSAPLYSTLVS